MPLTLARAHTAWMHRRSAQSAVSMTSVLQGTLPLRTSATSSSSIAQLVGWGRRATFSRLVPPSVSMNTGSGKWEAKVDLPMPSGPYSTVLTGAVCTPVVTEYLLI